MSMNPDQQSDLLRLRALLRERFRLEDEIRRGTEGEELLPPVVSRMLQKLENVEKELREAVA